MENLSDDDVFKPKKRPNSSPPEEPDGKKLSRPLSCKSCEATFSLRKNLNRHERGCKKPPSTPHSEDIIFNCKSCELLFTSKSNLKRHEHSCVGGIKYNCSFCEASFKRKDNCNRHESNCNANPDVNPDLSQCLYCKAKFKRREYLDNHLKKCSFENPKKERKKIPCLVQNCPSTFSCKIDIIDHLSACHQDKITMKPKQSINFASIEEFNVWKEKEEEKTFSHFTARRGQESATIRHYYCQHDGSGKAHRKTNEKPRKTVRCHVKGRVKVGHHCTAKMKVTISPSSVEVIYYPTHSHRCKKDDMLHHPIPSAMSNYINEKLGENIPPDVVYDLTKQLFIQKNDKFLDTRASILTKKRVSERGRKRQNARRLHKDDASSVFLMAQKFIEKDNSVLLYKPLGQGVVHGPKTIDNLPDYRDLFMFGFQTDEQLEVMKKHCSKVIVADLTHGTNQYKFQLLTAMVIDDDHHGWPVGHLITSRADGDTLKFFFQALRSRLDPYHPLNCVMTDDDWALINAMEAGFSQSLTHLLCKWHVIKKLKDKLRTKVPKELRETMFDEIKVILNAETESLFLQLKEGFIRKYKDNKDAAKYLAYLNKHYWNRARKWAACYRNFPHGGINTTGHLESFHNRLKKCYLKRKVNKRIDDLINILLGIAWDDHCTRLRNASVGFSVQPREILERHKRGIAMDDNVIVGKTVDGLWEVKSALNKNPYFIEHYKDSCDSDHCFSKCTKAECHGLCSHLFSCSCPDNHPLCKHIHKLQSFLFRGVPFVPFEEEFYNFDSPNTDEEVCNHESATDESATDENANVPTHDQKKRMTLEKLKSHVSYLQQFLSKDIQDLSDHSIYQGEALLSDYVHSLQVAEKIHITVPAMKPVSVSAPNEKLKTQISQLLPFKRPSKRKLNEDAATRAAKRQAAIDGLLLNEQDNPIEDHSMELCDGFIDGLPMEIQDVLNVGHFMEI